MVYLQAENITKSFGDLTLFENLSLSIHQDQKVAIVARNGAGKTTLLNIIAGTDQPDSGQIVLRNGITVGYLAQSLKLDETKTIFEEIYNSASEVMQIIKEYEIALVSDNKLRLEKALEKMEAAQAWDHEVKVHQIVAELQLPDGNIIIGNLSGGQKKRVALASLLINDPDLLILDEPTNHLDLEMIEWLEEFLSRSGCTLLMVTHDRYFLDRVCNEILELDNKTLYQYKGNYSYFLEKRSERIDVQNSEVEKARNLFRKELDWIRRMPKARTTKAKYRVEAFTEIQEKASQKIVEKNVEIKISAARLGNKILEISNLGKAYGEKLLIKDFTYMFRRFEKIGIIGKNGSGKTTFLNLITNLVKPDTGHFEYGETVVLGYYKQEDLKFKEGQRVIDIVKEIAEVVTPIEGKKLSVSQFLNYFLFTNAMQHTPVEKLSGGERRRLHLVTILMRNPNFLILDEPTNDLDIMTLNVLEEYLKEFPGCLVVVSHDRFFLDKISDHLFVFDGFGAIKDYPGNYSNYRDWAKKQIKVSDKTIKEKKPEKEITISTEKAKKLTWKEKKEFETLESEIESLNNEKIEIEQKLSTGTLSSEEVTNSAKRLSEVLNLIDEKELRWLELSEIG
ncbi:MAG: ABC-F family ATP-binding cassette domain-containing protein [Bacteroidia bacterium]|nr:ABC-F family ATP-binding cassette domain-containing protein [Bacteroidia bacterium]